MKLPFKKDLTFKTVPVTPDATERKLLLSIYGSDESIWANHLLQVLGKLKDNEDFLREARWLYHAHRGCQLLVRQPVSSDLIASDIHDPDFSSLIWPSRSMEVFFEDPRIPSMLVIRDTPGNIIRFVAGLAGEDLPANYFDAAPADRGFNSELTIITTEGLDGCSYMQAMDDESMNRMAAFQSEQISDGLNKPSIGSFSLNTDEDAAMCWMTNMLFKVLLFATSTGHAPAHLPGKRSKKSGGKPGYKGRPKLKTMVIEYLPKQIILRKKMAQEEIGNTHAFNGRRGHWRTYRAERYTHKQGTTDYIYPIPGPDGRYPNVRFVVRKPLRPALG